MSIHNWKKNEQAPERRHPIPTNPIQIINPPPNPIAIPLSSTQESLHTAPTIHYNITITKRTKRTPMQPPKNHKKMPKTPTKLQKTRSIHNIHKKIFFNSTITAMNTYVD